MLIIVEAQNLSVTVLEQMRLRTNLETSQRKSRQIILNGQSERPRCWSRRLGACAAGASGVGCRAARRRVSADFFGRASRLVGKPRMAAETVARICSSVDGDSVVVSLNALAAGGPAVSWLAMQLIGAGGGGEPTPATPAFDADMVLRLKQYQLPQGLIPDSTLGPQTLLRLRGFGDGECSSHGAEHRVDIRPAGGYLPEPASGAWPTRASRGRW